MWSPSLARRVGLMAIPAGWAQPLSESLLESLKQRGSFPSQASGPRPARQAGVAPRVIAKALGLNGSRTVRNMLRTFAERLKTSPALGRLAQLP